MTKTYRNTKFVKRNYECTNVIACVADAAPADHWVEADDSILTGLTKLHIVNGVAFYGHL